jgi:class 3 adenylate cyclase
METGSFRELLRRRMNQPGAREEIDEEIRRRFETDLAVLMTDSVGFTRRTLEKGIIHVLSVLLMHRDLLEPLIEQHNGRLLKGEADNLFCVFPSVKDAVSSARAMNEELARYNAAVPKDSRIEICTGIGYGRVLRTEDDAFGDQVNQASKLGEDTAKAGEILLTKEAKEALDDPDFKCEPREIEAAEGLKLKYYCVDAD